MMRRRMVPAALGAAVVFCGLAMPLGAALGAVRDPDDSFRRGAVPGTMPAAMATLPAAPVSLTVPALQARLQQGGPLGGGIDAAALEPLYASRGFAPLWVDDRGVAPNGQVLIAALDAAQRAGAPLDAALVETIRGQRNAASPDARAGLELMLDAALGQGLAAARRPLDGAPATLGDVAEAAQADDLAGWLAGRLPQDPDYWGLAKALDAYRAIAAQGGWPALPLGPKLVPGVSDPRIAILRQRMLASGDAEAVPGGDVNLFDAPLAEAVQRFQARHGLLADGIVGAKTVEAMNVPVQARIDQLLRSLDRVRRSPHPIDERHVFVNIPGAEVEVHEGGRVIYRDRVVVGRVDRQTPELKSVIDRLVVNPFWYVPVSIARKDLIGKGRKDSTYFSRLNIRVYASESANEIDPATIDWYSPQAQSLRFRQDPGPENALGPVKFDFDNPYAVYLHGTSHQDLFDKPARFFSSGCVRVEHPLDLAPVILAGDPRFDRAGIDALVAAGKTAHLQVPHPWPLEIAYLTAWVDEQGVVQFRPDIYGRDAPLRVEQIAGRKAK